MPGKVGDLKAKFFQSESSSKPNREQIMHIEDLDSLAKFCASFIHEVNNPLSGVLIYAQLLRKKIEGGEISRGRILEYLDKMQDELNRVTNLIHSLKDFAQQSTLDFSDVALTDIVDDALRDFNSTLALKKIVLQKELDLNLPKIKADSAGICRVLSNLIMNSIEAMPAGGRLALRAHRKGNHITLEVEDTGRGISESNLAKLFIPFFSTRPEVKGVGLGLSCVYGIVQKHGGSIEVRSREGQGSIFSLNLPIFSV